MHPKVEEEEDKANTKLRSHPKVLGSDKKTIS